MAEDTITVQGKTFTMYAGVIGKIDEALGGFSGLDEITLDVKMQEKVVNAVLTEYDENGNPKKDGAKINVFSLTPEDFRRVVDWAIEHYTVFMSNSSAAMRKSLKKLMTETTQNEKSSS